MIPALHLLVGACFALAANTADKKLLDQSTAFLRDSGTKHLTVEKTVVYDLLDKTQKSAGDIYVGQGKFRWETTSPEKSRIVFDGKTLWTLQEPPPSLGGAAQITKSQLSGKAKDQVLVKLLAGRDKFSSKFTTLKSEEKDGLKVYALEPVKKDPTIKAFSLAIDPSDKTLHRISYTDEVGNKTAIEIQKIEKVKKADPGLFHMEIPKGAEVNEL